MGVKLGPSLKKRIETEGIGEHTVEDYICIEQG
jgi:hypothetical protein